MNPNVEVALALGGFLEGHMLSPTYVHIVDGEATIGVTLEDLKRVSKGRTVTQRKINGAIVSYYMTCGPITVTASALVPHQTPDIVTEEVTL
jgi:riboflavin synthase alpha subunit